MMRGGLLRAGTEEPKRKITVLFSRQQSQGDTGKNSKTDSAC